MLLFICLFCLCCSSFSCGDVCSVDVCSMYVCTTYFWLLVAGVTQCECGNWTQVLQMNCQCFSQLTCLSNPLSFFFLFNWFFCLKLSSVEWGVWSFLILLCCDYVSLWSLMLLCIFHLSNIIYSCKFIIFNNYLVWFGWDNNFLCSPDKPWIHIVFCLSLSGAGDICTYHYNQLYNC